MSSGANGGSLVGGCVVVGCGLVVAVIGGSRVGGSARVGSGGGGFAGTFPAVQVGLAGVDGGCLNGMVAGMAEPAPADVAVCVLVGVVVAAMLDVVCPVLCRGCWVRAILQ